MPFRYFQRGFRLWACAVAWTAVSAQAALLVTPSVEASSVANLVFGGIPMNTSQVITGLTQAETQALVGSASTPEARTAARVSDLTIAVNARYDNKIFRIADLKDDDSQAFYSGLVENVSGSQRQVFLTFYLPPSYVETTSGAEIPYLIGNPLISAVITSSFCTSPSTCGPSTTQFEFQAYLDASFQAFSQFFAATGQPGLDVSPLLNPTLTDEYDSTHFLRTTHLGFPGFTGVLDLGSIPAGGFIQFSYHLEARVTGTSEAGNISLASINDPFLVSTDPVQPGAPISVTDAPVNAADVPECGGFLLVASGLGFFLVYRRFRRGASRVAT